jgi:hypothetical protein
MFCKFDDLVMLGLQILRTTKATKNRIRRSLQPTHCSITPAVIIGPKTQALSLPSCRAVNEEAAQPPFTSFPVNVSQPYALLR